MYLPFRARRAMTTAISEIDERCEADLPAPLSVLPKRRQPFLNMPIDVFPNQIASSTTKTDGMVNAISEQLSML